MRLPLPAERYQMPNELPDQFRDVRDGHISEKRRRVLYRPNPILAVSPSRGEQMLETRIAPPKQIESGGKKHILRDPFAVRRYSFDDRHFEISVLAIGQIHQ